VAGNLNLPRQWPQLLLDIFRAVSLSPESMYTVLQSSKSMWQAFQPALSRATARGALEESLESVRRRRAGWKPTHTRFHVSLKSPERVRASGRDISGQHWKKLLAVFPDAAKHFFIKS